MTKSYLKTEFHMLMEKVKAVEVRVKNYLKLADYDKWARSYASVHRGWTLTSSIAESINVALVSARELPIYDFLEEVRLMFGRWNCENRQQALYTFTDLIDKFQEVLQQNEAECTRMKVIPASEYIYTVHDKEKHFIVCLKEKKCSCNAFQLDEIPCVYACAVLDIKNFKKGPYYSDLYKPKIVLRTYDLPIYPLPHKDDWVIPKQIMYKVVLPSKYKRLPERPSKKDREKFKQDMFGKKSKNCCSSYGLKGHNRRSCRKYNK
ncbi:uncharacterized protein LOC124890078 [Capsicum annuum]|uniref:uncharacterized protein LOC107877761 n=1 Tax=Capsicum annuum TaxID=4072 RepID=UPI0007BEE74C|nr:uncharacterized protein LOC107877761 [Capsicum annuum]XP_016579955.1 uncharacterized protein LOC107877761 [Capsicum annuum]XP_047257905.1 uncharacterized protein LOC124890078 [Capsicum annuum]XP_047257906.1 uncharacterized protein LOC124890078 [Capsicum annuum]